MPFVLPLLEEPNGHNFAPMPRTCGPLHAIVGIAALDVRLPDNLIFPILRMRKDLSHTASLGAASPLSPERSD